MLNRLQKWPVCDFSSRTIWSNPGFKIMLKGWGRSRVAMPPSNLWKKIYILVCILTKRILILALKFIYLAPSPQKIYKLTQEIQQIDNKKNL